MSSHNTSATVRLLSDELRVVGIRHQSEIRKADARMTAGVTERQSDFIDLLLVLANEFRREPGVGTHAPEHHEGDRGRCDKKTDVWCWS